MKLKCVKKNKRRNIHHSNQDKAHT